MLTPMLGIPLERVKFPFVPACMAAAGPTEWLKFFKTFAVFLCFRFFVADESCSVGQASFLHQ